MENRKAIGERIRKLRKIVGLTQIQFGKILKTPDSNIRKWEKGEALPNVEKLLLMQQNFGVNLNWLLTGKGKMFLEEDRDNRIDKEILNLLNNEPDVEKKKALLEFLKKVWVSEQHSSLEKSSHQKQKNDKIF
jgi:transcriptional regulator with XRE-family HTH domain